MKVRRFSIPSVILLVLVISAGITAGLISAKNQAQDLHQSPLDIVGPPVEPSPTPAPLQIPDPPEKSQLVILKDERPSSGTSPLEDGSSQAATVYTWQDGDRIQRVLLQEHLAVQDTGDSKPGDVVVAKAGESSIVRNQAGPQQTGPQQEGGPVFLSESGGTLMTLPGGVLLKLDSNWDQDTVEEFLSDNGIETERASPLGFIENTFFVETEPGFASLELANSLAAKEGVEISSPNWWMDVEAK